jgi:hypothetical protein
VPGRSAGPVAPLAPVAPVAPGAPVAPVAPVPPVAPVAPVLPAGPAAPVGPVGPLLPVGPVDPVGPVSDATQVPVKAAVSGAASLSVSVAVSPAWVDGVNCTVIVHVCSNASVRPWHASAVIAKSAALVPDTAAPLILSPCAPTFVTVTALSPEG